MYAQAIRAQKIKKIKSSETSSGIPHENIVSTAFVQPILQCRGHALENKTLETHVNAVWL